MNYKDREEEFISLLKERLDDYRFAHSINVAKSAVMLADKYGADKEKAYIAGLLHDVTKNESDENQLQIFKDNGIMLSYVEENNHKLWHAMSGSVYVKEKLNIDDEEITGAIRYHTTGKKGMTLLEKIIYIADYISEERDYPDVDIMRQLSDESLEEAALYSLKYTFKKLSSLELPIHNDSLDFYNELVISKRKD